MIYAHFKVFSILGAPPGDGEWDTFNASPGTTFWNGPERECWRTMLCNESMPPPKCASKKSVMAASSWSWHYGRFWLEAVGCLQL